MAFSFSRDDFPLQQCGIWASVLTFSFSEVAAAALTPPLKNISAPPLREQRLLPIVASERTQTRKPVQIIDNHKRTSLAMVVHKSLYLKRIQNGIVTFGHGSNCCDTREGETANSAVKSPACTAGANNDADRYTQPHIRSHNSRNPYMPALTARTWPCDSWSNCEIHSPNDPTHGADIQFTGIRQDQAGITCNPNKATSYHPHHS
jgi:hypothetical protein